MFYKDYRGFFAKLNQITIFQNYFPTENPMSRVHNVGTVWCACVHSGPRGGADFHGVAHHRFKARRRCGILDLTSGGQRGRG
jgi:hypothetical protein